MPGYPGVPTLHPCTGTAEFWLWELLLQGHPVDVRDVRGGPNVRWRTRIRAGHGARRRRGAARRATAWRGGAEGSGEGAPQRHSRGGATLN